MNKVESQQIPLASPIREAMPANTMCRDCQNILNDCEGDKRRIMNGYWIVSECSLYKKEIK